MPFADGDGVSLQIAAVVMEKSYTVGIVVSDVLTGMASDSFQVAAIYTKDANTALLPSLDNLRGCYVSGGSDVQQISKDDLLNLNLFDGRLCYPLSVPIYVKIPKNYKQDDCRDLKHPSAQTVEWWSWMLMAENINKPMESQNLMHLTHYGAVRGHACTSRLAGHPAVGWNVSNASANRLKMHGLLTQAYVRYANETLHSITCNWQPILTVASSTSYRMPAGVVAALATILTVLALVSVVLMYVFHKKRKVERQLSSLQGRPGSLFGWKQLDLDSPIMKVEKFLMVQTPQ